MEGFLPLQPAAAGAGVSVRTMKRWMAKGLPWYHAGPGTKVLILPSDIQKFLTREQRQKLSLDVLVNETLAQLGEKQKQKGIKAVTQKRNGDLTP